MLGQNWGIHNNLPFWTQFFLIFLLLKFAVPLDAADPTEKSKSEPCKKWTIVCNEEKTKCYDALIGDDGKSKPTKRFNIGAQDCGEEIEIDDNLEANKIFDYSNINIAGEGKFLADSVKNNANFCRKPSSQSKENGSKGTVSKMMATSSSSSTAKCLLSFTIQTTTTVPSTIITTTLYPPFTGNRCEENVQMKELLKGMGDGEVLRTWDKAILIKAKPMENWRNISFTIYSNDTEKMKFFNFRPVFWQFVIYNNVEENNQKMEVSYMKNVSGKMKSSVESKIDENNFFSDKKEFELMLNLRMSNIDIFINETAFNWTFLLSNYSEVMDSNRKFPYIDVLKIEADADLKESKGIYGMGGSMIILGKQINDEKRATLQFKVFTNAKWFLIRFIAGSRFINEQTEYECFDAKSIRDRDCIIQLFIEVDFEKGTTVLGDYFAKIEKDQDGKEVAKRTEIPSKAKFESGKVFRIKVEREKPKGKFIITYDDNNNGLVEYYECEVEGHPYMIQVKGDIRLLDFSFEKRNGN